jgi:hypothetical protein
MVWLNGWMRPCDSAATGSVTSRRSPASRCVRASLSYRFLDLVLEAVQSSALLAPCVRIEAGEALHQRSHPALLAEEGDARLLQSVAARRRLDQAKDLVADMIERFHRAISSARKKGAHRPLPLAI